MKNMYQDEFLDAMEILADNTIKFIEKDCNGKTSLQVQNSVQF